MIDKYGPVGSASFSFDEAFNVMAQGKAYSYITYNFFRTAYDDPSKSAVVGKVEIMPVPLPTADDALRGVFTLGPASDLTETPGNSMGLARTSRNPDVAMDFMRYLTSQPVSKQVMHASNRLSTIVGVPPPESIAGFAPRTHGGAWPQRSCA